MGAAADAAPGVVALPPTPADIPVLVDNARGNQLLSKVPLTLERGHAALLLWNLAVCNDDNRKAIAAAGGLAALKDLAGCGSEEAKHAAAGALAYCALLEENHVEVLKAVPALVALVAGPRARAAQVSSLALLNLSASQACLGAIAAHVPALLAATRDHVTQQEPESAVLVKQCVQVTVAASLEEKHRRAGLLACWKDNVAHLVELMCSGDVELASNASVLLHRMVEIGEPEVAEEVLEAGILPTAVAVCKAGVATIDGLSAAVQLLAWYSIREQALARIVEEEAVPTLVGMLTPPPAADDNKKKKPKKGKEPPLPPAQAASQCAAATILSRVSATADGLKLLVEHNAKEAMEKLLECPNDTTRASCRIALWNMKSFGVPDSVVKHFRIDAEILTSGRPTPLTANSSAAPFRSTRSAAPRAGSSQKPSIPRLVLDAAHTDANGFVAPLTVSARSGAKLDLTTAYDLGGGPRSARVLGSGGVSADGPAMAMVTE